MRGRKSRELTLFPSDASQARPGFPSSAFVLSSPFPPFARHAHQGRFTCSSDRCTPTNPPRRTRLQSLKVSPPPPLLSRSARLELILSNTSSRSLTLLQIQGFKSYRDETLVDPFSYASSLSLSSRRVSPLSN